MTTIQKLNAYGSALEKWRNKKRRHDLAEEAKRPERNPLPSCPTPDEFGLSADDFYANKTRDSILNRPWPIMEPANLDEILEARKRHENKIKLPTRKTI